MAVVSDTWSSSDSLCTQPPSGHVAGVICNSSVCYYPQHRLHYIKAYFYFGKNFMGGYKQRDVDSCTTDNFLFSGCVFILSRWEFFLQV